MLRWQDLQQVLFKELHSMPQLSVHFILNINCL